MKHLTILLFILVPLFSISQTTVAFKIVNGKPVTTDKLSEIKLPLQLSFTTDFKNIELVLKNKANNQKINDKQIIGQGELKFTDNQPFVFVIEQDKKTNPGDNNVPSSEITLTLSGHDFQLHFNEENQPPIVSVERLTDAYQAGYIYYDVIKLLDKQTNAQTRQIIWAAYGITAENIDDNYIIKDLYGADFVLENRPQGILPVSLLTMAANADVTYFAAGLARFLVERTKEELNEAFFKKMQQQLNTYPELKTLFPQTNLILNIIDAYTYASVIQALKEAFETDIKNLTENLYNFKTLSPADCDALIICGGEKQNCNGHSKCQKRLSVLNDFFKSHSGHWMSFAMYAAKEAMISANPATLIKNITSATECHALKASAVANKKYDDYNVVSAIELSNSFAQSLLSKDINQVWITPEQFRALTSKNQALKTYLGLLASFEFRKNDKQLITFYKSDSTHISFGTMVNEIYKRYNDFEPQVVNLISNIYSAYNLANNAAKKMIEASQSDAEANAQVLYNYYHSFSSAITPIINSALIKTFSGKDILISYQPVERFLNPSVDIAYYVATRKYTSAIYSTSLLLSGLNAFIVTNDEGEKEKFDGFKPITKSFVKYGTLISSVANAQSSDEVKQAIAASVLPVGSAAIKKNTAWSIAANAYVGGFYGIAYVDSNNIRKHYNTYGLYAPVGMSFNKGFKSGWGLTLSAQIIDVGALVNFYALNGDETALPSDLKIRLSNIFAPGVQLGINIPKTPLTVMYGFQFVPALHQITQAQTTAEIIASNAVRMHVALAVDLPLYNIKVWDFNK